MTAPHETPAAASHGGTVTLTEICRLCALSAVEVEELVEYGALVPLGTEGGEPLYAADRVGPLRTASKLRRIYDLDVFTAGLLLGLLARIEGLEAQLRRAHAHAPLQPHPPRDGPQTWREPH